MTARILVSLLVLSILLVGAPVLAQAPAAQVSPPSADEYTRRVRAAIEQVAGGDLSGGTAALRSAIELDPARPEAHVYLATALRMAGELEGALATFRRAAELAQAPAQGRWRGRALAGAASTLERMPNRVEEARTAWQEYTRFADANQAVADPQVGRARVQAIDIMNEQEQVYANVRQRIAEREVERQREQQEAAQPAQRRSR